MYGSLSAVTHLEKNRMTKLITAAALLALSVPALAQGSFYIVQDTTTKRCQVVKERPTRICVVVKLVSRCNSLTVVLCAAAILLSVSPF